MTDPVQLAVGVDGHASAWRVPRRPGWTTCDAHPMSDALVPGGYGDLLAEITSEVRVARLRAARTVNSELLALPVDRTNRRLADGTTPGGVARRIGPRCDQPEQRPADRHPVQRP